MTTPLPPNVGDINRSPDSLSTEVETVRTADEINWHEEFVDLSDRYETIKIEFNEYKRRETANDILNTLIKPYSGKIFWFMVGYCSFVGILLLANLFFTVANPISDTVMSFLVGSTATTVLGLVGMIVSGIFTGARKPPT